MKRLWRRFVAFFVSDESGELPAYMKYERIAAYPLFLLSILFLAAFVITIDPNSDAVDLRFARIVIPVTWAAFAIDYVIGFTLSPHKGHFVRSHVLQALALLFPPLRILLLGHVVHVLRKAPMRSGDRAYVYLLYLTTLLMVVSAIMVVYFERRDPASNITSFGTALWWVGETVSTVGYGDYYPVTLGGRLVAGVLFVNGVAMLSIITAGLAQRFVRDDARAEVQAAEADVADEVIEIPRADLVALHNRVAELQDALTAITSRVEDVLETTSKKSGSPAGTDPDPATPPSKSADA